MVDYLENAGPPAMPVVNTGPLRYVPHDAEEPRYVRLLVEFSEGDRLAYINPRRIGHVCLTDSAGSYIADQRLGPDALDAAFDETAFGESLAGRKQAIKAVLMDQARIAGIGNIYADEIL